ncbi:MAG: radical SAM protein [Candidatus Methanosuratus sp.]|nr:radical SAM protein [Candidatus Methanosuratincola sp.]
MAKVRRLPIKKYLSTLKYAAGNYARKDFRYPFYCTFKVIQRCDSRCEFCDVWRKPMPDMPTGKVLRIIDNIAKSSVILLSMEGGEPLLRKDIGEILEYVNTKPLYLLFTTSGKLIDRRPMREYAKYIDFLHISIDEGHGNLDLFESLPEYATWGPTVCAQIVVMREYLKDLEWKVQMCFRAGAKAVVMPACHLPGTDNHLPEIAAFRDEVLRLKKKYPQTVITTERYLKTLDVPNSCNTASVLIDADGRLYYPCNINSACSINASQEPILDFLLSEKARKCREMMRSCYRNCHCYLYFAMDSSLSIRSTISALKPYLSGLF